MAGVWAVAIGSHRTPSGRIGRAVVVGVSPPAIDPHRSWLPAPLRVAVAVQKSGMEFFFFSAKPMGLTTYAPREKLEFFSDRADSPADLTPRGGILPKSVVIFFAGVIFWKKPVIFDKKGQ